MNQISVLSILGKRLRNDSHDEGSNLKNLNKDAKEVDVPMLDDEEEFDSL